MLSLSALMMITALKRYPHYDWHFFHLGELVLNKFFFSYKTVLFSETSVHFQKTKGNFRRTSP